MQLMSFYVKILESFGYEADLESMKIGDDEISFLYTIKDSEEKFIWIVTDKYSATVNKIFISSDLIWTDDTEFGTRGVTLYESPDKNSSERYGLNLFEEVLKSISNPVYHEFKISEAHAKNMEWVYEALWPVLKEFNYEISDLGILNMFENINDDNSVGVYFENKDQIECGASWATTDIITGELESCFYINRNKRDIAWKDSKEIREIIKEELNKK